MPRGSNPKSQNLIRNYERNVSTSSMELLNPLPDIKEELGSPDQPLTLKQKKFIKAYLMHGNKARAVRDAGYDSEDSAVQSAIGIKNLNKANVRKAIREILDSSGLSVSTLSSYLATTINSGMGIKATNADSIRGIELAMKLHDMFPATKHNIKSSNVSIDLKGKSIRELKEEYNRLITEAIDVTDSM